MPSNKDHFLILKKITVSRFFNGLKLYVSYLFSKITKKNYHWGLPASIAIEPTTSCNLRCPECPSGLRSFTRPTGMLQTTLFEKLIDELHPSLLYLIFYFQGEPYLNTSFLDMVSYATKRNIYTATSTNAHYLNDENCRKTIQSGLNRLIISIDGTTQETYQSYRVGGKLDKVIEGTKNIVKWKKEMNAKTPHLIFQFLVVKPNEHQIEDVLNLAEELGIDEVRFKTAQVYDYKNGNDLIPDNEAYSRYYKNNDGTYSIKNKMLNHCWKMWHSCVVTWDGKVVPCCFDKDAKHNLGEMQLSTFRTIWKSAAYNKFRASVLRSRSEIEMCKNCTEGTKVFA
ncbi:MAG TPA: SPASM domain-containing protein [Bacteroidia bacterium]|nr:SPASM domain-containing protein [Bacteroidia bacterium]